MRDKFDVVIVGGAAVGSAAAYFLARAGGLRVLVLERDPSYRDCATTRSLASHALMHALRRKAIALTPT